MMSWAPEVRPEPLSCKACGGRKLGKHCNSPSCHWRACGACGAVNGVVACYRQDGSFSRFVRAAFGASKPPAGDFKSD